MIKIENDFLGLLISCADENHNCDVFEVISESGMSDIDCLPFMKSLQEKGLTETLDMETIHIYPKAYDIYVPKAAELQESIVKASKFTIKSLFNIIVGIIVAVISGFIIYHFGWQ